MIYLDNGATSMYKPPAVAAAMGWALEHCANPGRGGHPASMAAARAVLHCRERAAGIFDCKPEQVVFTASCTQGLNTAIRTLVKPGSRVAISGFEHNAVTRPLYALGANIQICGRHLFNWDDTLESFEKALRHGIDAAVFTHVSNVFGYILPVKELSELCRQYGVPFILDAAQSAGALPVKLRALGADFIAMPGHKGLLGPMGTGLLLCGSAPEPLLYGGTGSLSASRQMPRELPDRAEAGTLNVPGIAGLGAALAWLEQAGIEKIGARAQHQAHLCARGLQELGMQVFAGEHQAGTVSFVPPVDCEEFADRLARRGIAVRAGLHCAPVAHESAGTLTTGTVRVSFGHDAQQAQTRMLLDAVEKGKNF